MQIFVGADHRGFQLKSRLITLLKRHGYEVADEGDEKLDPNDDFPVFAQKVVGAVLASSDHDARGILVCGSGQGMCMAANRFKGIRAALAFDKESARSARNDDDSNVLCLPASVLKTEDAGAIVQTWLDTPFAAAPRYVRRIKELDDIG
jgi:ribose 5-phosphate isomerase B